MASLGPPGLNVSNGKAQDLELFKEIMGGQEAIWK
jgi:hypothetical protein